MNEVPCKDDDNWFVSFTTLFSGFSLQATKLIFKKHCTENRSCKVKWRDLCPIQRGLQSGGGVGDELCVPCRPGVHIALSLNSGFPGDGGWGRGGVRPH